MKVTIWFEPLDEQSLAEEVERAGFVVFTTEKARQRELAAAVLERLRRDSRVVREGEAISPNHPVCIVDISRHAYHEVRAAAVAEDTAWWAGTPALDDE